jgi:hypothetical protein
MGKAVDEGFSKSSVKGFYEKRMTEAVFLAHDCLVKPAQWDNYFHRAAASMILSVAYGHPAITSEQDPTIQAVNSFASCVTRAAYPGVYLVYFSPGMRHIPSR